MRQKIPFNRAVLCMISFALSLFLIQRASWASSAAEPRVIHNDCTSNCVVDAYILHANKGDTSAKATYHAWYNSYYTNTGCGDTSWMNEFSFLIDVISDIVGAPGAPTLQCWQGVMAQASACSKTCSEYFVRDAKFAPNARLSLSAGVPGWFEATIDNESNLNKLPELQPNAYTRRFHLLTTLQCNGGSPVLVGDADLPSLSFPNWVTRGGYSDCITAYGAGDQRCKLIENMPIPSAISSSVDFLDGVFYDLTSQVSSLADANGSFSRDGYIRLLSNGDSITIKRGPYAGFAWVKTHNKSKDTHTQRLIPWDASSGDVKITNSECNSLLSTCWITGDRTDSDTYVFALSGPSDKRLPGTYTVQVIADIAHEKDFSDNRASYSYDASAVDSQPDDPQEDPGGAQGAIRVDQLPVIDLPGPGNYASQTPAGMPGALYRLRVPQGVRFLYFRLTVPDDGQFSMFTRRSVIPVPDFPVIRDDYNCWAQADSSFAGICPFSEPLPDSYYIFINRLQGSAYRLEVYWRTTPPQNEQETQQENEAQKPENRFTEVEDNNSRAAANPWDMRLPFTGQIARLSDRDYVFLDIPESGIYTFSLTNVAPEMTARISLLRGKSGNYLTSSKASAYGGTVHLSFDASKGEQYYLVIQAHLLKKLAVNQSYQLSLSGFIPDPQEPNDERKTATLWDIAQPIQGYMWDRTTGWADYYRFIAPQTAPGTVVTFELTNPDPNMRIHLTLLSNKGYLGSTPYSQPGQPVTFSKALIASAEYFIKVDCLYGQTSSQPYTLSARYTPGSGTMEQQTNAKPARLYGVVYQQGSLLPVPLKNVSVYAEAAGQPPVLLGITGALGTYSKTINIADGQSVQIYAVKEGLTFQPQEDVWSPDASSRSRYTVFRVVGAQLTQATLTATVVGAATPLPPIIQTARVSPRPTQARTPTPTTLPARTQTSQPSLTQPPTQARTPTPSPMTASPTSPASQSATLITGKVWRLFPASPAAGVGAARVILSVNGMDRPAVMSMIDGSYTIQVSGLQPGDQLRLRAENPGETFEPAAYQWRAEAGVSQWTYDFYSYQGTITPPARDDQNRIFGRVVNSQGVGVAGVYLVVQMGSSDALQRIGPTNASGSYEAFVRLPSRIMAAIWVEQPGYLPSRVQFFHAYAPENREINFWQPPAVPR